MRFSMVCSVKAALRSACWIFCTLAHEPKNLDEDCRLLPFRLIRPAVCEMAVRDAYSRPPDGKSKSTPAAQIQCVGFTKLLLKSQVDTKRLIRCIGHAEYLRLFERCA